MKARSPVAFSIWQTYPGAFFFSRPVYLFKGKFSFYQRNQTLLLYLYISLGVVKDFPPQFSFIYFTVFLFLFLILFHPRLNSPIHSSLCSLSFHHIASTPGHSQASLVFFFAVARYLVSPAQNPWLSMSAALCDMSVCCLVPKGVPFASRRINESPACTQRVCVLAGVSEQRMWVLSVHERGVGAAIRLGVCKKKKFFFFKVRGLSPF